MKNITPGLKEYVSRYSILKYSHWDSNLALNSKNGS